MSIRRRKGDAAAAADGGSREGQAIVVRAEIAPTLSLGSTLVVHEDEGLTRIANSGQLSDADSPNMGGGSLVVSLADVRPTDRIGIFLAGGEIFVNGTDVTYFGTSIGTLSGGGAGAATLTVAFNANATPAAVQSLIQNIGYEYTEQNGPSSDTRTFTFTVSDGSGGTTQAQKSVFAFAANDAPVYANFNGDVANYVEDAPFVRLDQGLAVTITDVDSANFNGGTLYLLIQNNWVAGEDRLGVASGSGVSIDLNVVRVNGTVIGTCSGGGAGSAELIINFNNSASIALVTELVGALSYSNGNRNNPSTLQRTIGVTLSDGDANGGPNHNSVQALVHVNVARVDDPLEPEPLPPTPPLTITNTQISDFALSADGLRIYTINSQNGLIQAFRAETGDLISTWDAGHILNYAGLSLDGRYMLASGYQVLSSTPGGPNPQTVSTLATYKVDLATGQITQLLYEAHGYDRQFGDVAWLDSGKVMITMGASDAGGQAGYGQTRLLDPDTGQYTVLDIHYAGTLFGASDGNRVLATAGTTRPSLVYDAEDGIIASSVAAALGGRAAYSQEAGLVVRFAGGTGLTVYDANLQLVAQLTQHNPQFQDNIEALAFDQTGQFLFLLDDARDSIHQLRVSDWSLVQSIPLGFALDYDTNGPATWLQVGPDMRYFLVNKFLGLVRVDNPLFTDSIVGTLGADSLGGTAGNDFLIGDSGADTMTGLAGDDLYSVDHLGDVIVEAASGGTDTVRASSSYVLGANAEVERLEAAALNGNGALDLTGNAFAQTITGNMGANFLIGGGGADTLVGLRGDDRFLIDSASDAVVEAVGGGFDIVFTSTSYTLGAGVSVEVLSTTNDAGTDAINLGGNSLANTIIGNAGANTLNGGGGADDLTGFGGNDTYLVDHALDIVREAAGQGFDVVYAYADYALGAAVSVEFLSTANQGGTEDIDLTGNELADLIYGNAGANVLNGGGGADTLVGLGGDDAYHVDNAGDITSETAGGGNDIVYASLSWVLGTDIEALSALNQAGTEAFTFTGNAGANAITGNAGSNLLNGGAGADTLTGLGGHDVYLLDNGADAVVEGANGGYDTAYVYASYTIAAGVELEVLSAYNWYGLEAFNLTGNEFANGVYGNGGVNTLDGGGGADMLIGFGGGGDTMVGGAGDDQYFTFHANDIIVESAGGGHDGVFAYASFALAADDDIEILSTYSFGGSEVIDLTGNALAQIVYGNTAANLLNGGGGADTITGFAGADTFAFTTALGAGNVDRVTDMTAGTDKIALDDAIFTGLGLGALSAGAFVTGAAAADADDRIVYDSTTGALSFDADGNGVGAAVQFATLSTGLALTASDFTVI